jgi:hypothetical protein
MDKDETTTILTNTTALKLTTEQSQDKSILIPAHNPQNAMLTNVHSSLLSLQTTLEYRLKTVSNDLQSIAEFIKKACNEHTERPLLLKGVDHYA